MSDETNNNTTITEKLKTVGGQKILKSKIIRGNDGVKLELQSPIDWSFLKRSGGNYDFDLGGVKCFRPRADTFAGVNAHFYTEDVYEYRDKPNLSVLLAKNIKDGVVFNFGIMPFSDQKARDYLLNLKDSVKILYLTYVKPFSITCEVTSSTVEKEIHD